VQRIKHLAVGFAGHFLRLLQRLLGFLRELIESDHRDLLSFLKDIGNRSKSGGRLGPAAHLAIYSNLLTA
jgi:hypothetical protein